jgi:hypothetical protein
LQDSEKIHKLVDGKRDEAFNNKNNLKEDFLSNRISIQKKEENSRGPSSRVNLSKKEILSKIDGLLNSQNNIIYTERFLIKVKERLQSGAPIFKIVHGNTNNEERVNQLRRIKEGILKNSKEVFKCEFDENVEDLKDEADIQYEKKFGLLDDDDDEDEDNGALGLDQDVDGLSDEEEAIEGEDDDAKGDMDDEDDEDEYEEPSLKKKIKVIDEGVDYLDRKGGYLEEISTKADCRKDEQLNKGSARENYSSIYSTSNQNMLINQEGPKRENTEDKKFDDRGENRLESENIQNECTNLGEIESNYIPNKENCIKNILNISLNENLKQDSIGSCTVDDVKKESISPDSGVN